MKIEVDVSIRIESTAAKCKQTASLATLQRKDADTGYRTVFRRLSERFDPRTTEAAAQRVMLYTDSLGVSVPAASRSMAIAVVMMVLFGSRDPHVM